LGSVALKSLKEKNRWSLWIIVAANALFFAAVARANAIDIGSLRSLVGHPQKLASLGFTVLIATVLNGVLSTESKARLVFLRWHNALPGHRAFSEYVRSDPRIEPARLEKILGSTFPLDPVDQNRAWYRIYKTVEKEPAVAQVHQDYLLLRDYTGLAVLFFVFNGTIGLYAISSLRAYGFYLCILFAQYVVARQAASHYGVRFVTTVLAHKTATTSPPKTGRTRSRAKTDKLGNEKA
jgi:hypothetical protein